MIVDDEDFEWLSNFNWCLALRPNRSPYVLRRKNRMAIYMHREILGLKNSPNDVYGHHINGNGLDNRKTNLKIVTAKEHFFLHNPDQ